MEKESIKEKVIKAVMEMTDEQCEEVMRALHKCDLEKCTTGH